MASRAASSLLCMTAFQEAAGHGWMTSPPARNSQSGPKNGYCPHCGNGNGICGDGNQWPADSNYVNFYNGPAFTWTEGSIVKVEVKVTAHHKGHYEFSVCDQVITGSLANAQACLDKHILQRVSASEAGISDCQPGDRRAACQPVDPRHPERFYLPPPGFSPDGSNTHKIFLKLPDGLACSACTMQWRWWSANSCIPASDYACFKGELDGSGYSSGDWGLGGSCPGGGCDRCGCGEEFRNCADITIESRTGTLPPTTPSTTVQTTTSMSLTVQTTTSTSSASQPRCRAVAVDGEAVAASDEDCDAACSVLPEGMWPCLEAGPCVCDETSPQPTPRPTPLPTAAPTPTPAPGFLSPAPTPAPACASCVGPSPCIWSDGVCYSAVAKAACQGTAGAVWCGAD